jgi:carbon-monoxide dehydrogenase large subunit
VPAVSEDLRPKLVGASVKRLEDPRLLTGQGTFVDDLQPRRLVHVAFRRSDQAHARILQIRAGDARKAAGVVGIFTADDLKSVLPVHALSRMRGYYATPLRPLADGKVRFVGEPVVAVVAESRYLAEDAAELIEIDYEPLPAANDALEAAADGAPLLHEDAGSNIIIAREFKRGDAEMDIAQAAVRVGGRFRFHRKTPMAIENRAALAEYRAGTLTVHSTTQVPGIIRDALVEALGLATNAVRVVAPDVGGGFGGKASLYPEEVLVAALARELNRPVKWTGDRMEDLVSTGQAFDEVIDAELGLTVDGAIVGLTADVTGDIGAYSIYPWTAGLEPVQVVSFLPGPYRVPAYRGHTRGVLPADFDVRDGTPDGHGGHSAEARSERASAAQPNQARGISLQDGAGHRLGPLRVYRVPREGHFGHRLRCAAPQAGGGARTGPLGRHRHRLLR